MEVKKEESTASFSQHGGVGESAGYEEEEKKGQGGGRLAKITDEISNTGRVKEKISLKILT